LTRRDVVDRFQPQERAVLLQSTALKQARSRIASAVRPARLLEAEQLGSTSVQPLRDRGIDRRAKSASLYRIASGLAPWR
jgi:hypothetical protein